MSLTANKKILIVDDHPLFRAMLVQLIGNEFNDWVCLEADNNQAALAIIMKEIPDAAILDITLNGASGLELLKSIKSHGIQLPVLVFSMHLETLYAERVIRAGAKGYISKLAPIPEVVEAIQKVMNREPYISAKVSAMLFEQMGKTTRLPVSFDISVLSDREIDVFQLLGHGLNSREIADRLYLGISTVDSYRARIREKLGIKNSAELYQRAALWIINNGF